MACFQKFKLPVLQVAAYSRRLTTHTDNQLSRYLHCRSNIAPPLRNVSRRSAGITSTVGTTLKPTELNVDDWTGRWQDGNTGFHLTDIHEFLENYNDKLFSGETGRKVFVPLCGKSLDMKWLADKGHSVVGVEGAEQAILEFFTEQNLEYTKETLTDLEGELYKSKDGMIQIYKCDFFEFPKCKEAHFDIVWDRCSLVAVNLDERERYANVIKSVVSSKSRMLLAIVDYTKNVWPGPPHLMTEDEVEKLFCDKYNMEVLGSRDAMQERWIKRGLTEMIEIAILFTQK